MTDSLYLLIPLGAAVIYSFSATLLKQSLENGIGPWRLTFGGNISSAIFICPLALLVDDLPPWDIFLYALPCGLLFVIGNTFTSFSLLKGDVSVATPILGTKVILVALFTFLFIEKNPSLSVWIGAFLTVLGITLMNLQFGERRVNLISTVILSILSAICFAALDVLIEKYSRNYGGLEFVSSTFFAVALGSFLLVPFFNKPVSKKSPAPQSTFYLACVSMGFQALGMALAIGLFGDATSINIVYSSRGIWSVLIIWALGHYFGNEENKAGTKTMTTRLTGATMILVAIILIL
ncbi:MAG: DMT family transporter [Bacteroidota bacterium]